jgi:hypothetical protein
VKPVRASGQQQFRGLFRKLVPAWAQDDVEGGPLLYSLGLLCDAVVEHARLALIARFPSHAPADAVSLIARDRKLVRGLGETKEAFAPRLVAWLDEHAVRGNPYALMRQVRGYCNAAVRVRTVDRRGNWYTIERDGSYAYHGPADPSSPGEAWDWDGGGADRWARFWVIIYPTAGGEPWSDPTLWGDPGLVWGSPGATWGSTATVDEVDAVRRIVRDWKPAGTRCEHIIIAFDDASFDPESATGLPDGTWSSASNRLATARYWRGTRNAA